MTTTPATARVEEFIRQWTLNPKYNQRDDKVYGIMLDADLDYTAQLYASDLRAILDELADSHRKRDRLLAALQDAAKDARDTRNHSMDSITTLHHHDGRASGFREAIQILKMTT